MNYWTALRLKFINGYRKYKKIIFVALIIWLVLIIINQILKRQPEKVQQPITTFTPHTSVVDSNKSTPEKYVKPIENLVETYFNYCNNGEYEKAYKLLTKDCRNANYPTLDSFKGYVDAIFEGKKKIYTIQCYSIVDNKYVYKLTILDDILATGTTDGYYTYETKIVLIEENGEIKLSIEEYIGEENPNIIVEDDYMIVKILNKTVEYETETYTIEVTNKTDNYIVLSDNYQANEILLDFGESTRNPNNMMIARFFVMPNSSMTQEVSFNKFYDTKYDAKNIILGYIRVLKEYDYVKGTTQENLDAAVKLYGLEIPLK